MLFLQYMVEADCTTIEEFKDLLEIIFRDNDYVILTGKMELDPPTDINLTVRQTYILSKLFTRYFNIIKIENNVISLAEEDCGDFVEGYSARYAGSGTVICLTDKGFALIGKDKPKDHYHRVFKGYNSIVDEELFELVLKESGL